MPGRQAEHPPCGVNLHRFRLLRCTLDFRFGSRFAVGMLIAEHPPHRSGRAQFEHPAPTLGIDGEALTAWPYAAQRVGHANPDLRPVRALLIRVPLGPRPSLHRLRHRKTGFVRRLHSYYGGVRLLLIVHRRLRLLTFPPRTITHKGLWPTRRSPGSRTKSLRACQVLRPRRAAQALALALLGILPSATQTASAPGISFLSRLDGWPARSPTDASPTSSRMPAHGSGPMWFAIPSS